MIALAHAKINLALVVGPVRSDGKHELLTIYQRLDLADRIRVEPAEGDIVVSGFAGDTLVRTALAALDASHGWQVELEKHIPVAAGLGGGSSDAATALELANAQLEQPLETDHLATLAASIGADVPFFLHEGPQLGSGDGTTLEPVDLPQGFAVCLLLPHGAAKASTGAVYGAFDERGAAAGFQERAAALREAIAQVHEPRDLGALPRNDLARSDRAAALLEAGAFRADVSGAGPVVYGLFDTRAAAEEAQRAVGDLGETWIAEPAW